VTLLTEEAPANSVPAAAVIRRVRALIGITGRKAYAGGLLKNVAIKALNFTSLGLRILRFPIFLSTLNFVKLESFLKLSFTRLTE